MAKKLEFSATIDGSGFRAGIVEMERLAGSAAGRMEKAMTGSLGGGGSVEEIARNRNAMTAASAREREKIQQEMAQADAALNAKMTSDWKKNTAAMRQGGLDPSTFGKTTSALGQIERGLRRTGVAYAQLLHVARASFDSLASGMPLTRVLAQQGPQLAQALIQMGAGMNAVYVAAAAGAAYGLYRFAKAMHDVYFEVERTSALADKLKAFMEYAKGVHKTRVIDSALANEKISGDFERAQAAIDYANEEADAVADLAKAKATAESLARQKDMNEKQRAEERIALEKKLLTIELERARIKLDQAKTNQPAAVAADIAKAEANLARVDQETDDAIESAQKKIDDLLRKYDSSTVLSPKEQREVSRQVAAAQNEYDLVAAEAREKVAAARKELEAARKRTGSAAVTAAEAKVKELENKLNEITLGKPAGTVVARPVSPGLGADSLTSVGNFLGGSRSMIESLARRQVDLLARIELNTRRTVASGGGIQWPTP